jgi:hypothetical protein
MTFFAVQKEAAELREQICQNPVWWKNPQELHFQLNFFEYTLKL